MRSRSVIMLASIAMILIATGVGNAFAYSYQNAEWSTWYAGAVSYPYGHTYGDPTTYGGALTWQNTFVNNDPGTNIIPALWSYTDQPNQQNSYQEGPTRQYHDSWCPDGSNMPVASQGDHTLTIRQQYLYEPSWWTIILGNNAGYGENQVSYYYAG